MTPMTLFASGRSAIQRVRRRPSVSLAVFLTLGLGISLTTSVFAILQAVLLRPLPIPEAQRVVWIETLAGGQADGSSPGLLFAWRAGAPSLQSIAGIREINATIEDAHGIDRVRGAYVTAEYFDVVGVGAARGRVFGPDLDRPGGDPVIVLSDRLWRQRFAGDEGIVGRSLTFNGRSRTVIGVLPPAFDEIDDNHGWWAPLALPESQRANLGASYLDVVGRLAAGRSAERARTELSAIAASVGAKADDGSLRGVIVRPFGRHLVAAHQPTLLLLFGAVIVLLAIACANVASLLLAEGLQRRAEMALRRALGAARGSLIAQVVLEALLLAMFASVFGIVLAQWLIVALVATLPAEIPRLALAHIDGLTVVFAVALGAGSALAGALLPALRSSGADAGDLLRTRGAVSAPGADRLRRAFVVGQIALTTALAAAAALLVQTTRTLERAPRGYDSSVLTATVALPGYAYSTASAQTAAFETLLRSMETVAGVSRPALATRVPLAGSGAGSDVARLDEDFGDRSDRQTRIRLVSPGFFATMGMAVVQGREVEAADRRNGRRVVVVNETLARRLARGGPLVGTPIKFELREFNDADRVTPWEVVGVVADTFDQGPRATVPPEIFVPIAQAPSDVLGWMGSQLLLAVRSDSSASLTAADMRAAIARAGLKIPLYDVRTVDERLAVHLARERALSWLFSLLGAAGLLLSGLGIFSIVHHLVRRRRRELALRLALGAAPSTLTRGVVREALVMAAVGVVLGFVVFRLFAGAVRPLLFGVGAGDPMTFGGIAIVLAAIAIGAAVGPARSVVALDPAAVLRDE